MSGQSPELSGQSPDELPPEPEGDASSSLIDTAYAHEVSGLVTRLREEAKLTPLEIAEGLEGRVTSRTVYRWQKRESVPGNRSDYDALMALVSRKCSGL